ncbi:IclR family transcriptional regulator [Pseudomonas putida]|uniref:IclR family transcriptional regulator n=1 Tax=Pseudomonas putida TaxID=303 RepID=UPI003570AFF7
MPTNDESVTPEPKSSSDGGVAAVDRAFAILSAFDTDRSSLPLAEISRRTGLYKSTILRLISSLERAGFVRRLPDGLYTIGHEPLRLAQIYQSSFRLRDAIYPVLEALTEETGETSSFYVIENDSRVVLFRVEPKRAVRFSIHEGDRFPLHAGASGKVLRAFGPPADKAVLDVLEQCWAVSYGERDPETASLSAPVFAFGQEFKGALTVSGPAERLNKEQVRMICQMLLKRAAQATNLLGGNNGQLLIALERLASQG